MADNGASAHESDEMCGGQPGRTQWGTEAVQDPWISRDEDDGTVGASEGCAHQQTVHAFTTCGLLGPP